MCVCFFFLYILFSPFFFFFARAARSDSLFPKPREIKKDSSSSGSLVKVKIEEVREGTSSDEDSSTPAINLQLYMETPSVSERVSNENVTALSLTRSMKESPW